LSYRTISWIAVFVSALAGGTGCSQCPSSSSTTTTPQVYGIAGAASGVDAYHVLILGAGFETDAELETYRAAAQTLAEGVLSDATYSSHTGLLSFWRIDVKSGSVDTSSCTSACGHVEVIAAPPATLTPAETLNPSGDAVIEQDLGVGLCYGGSSCLLLWADAAGQTAAAELAAFGPDIDAVVILANTQLWAGGTVQGALSGSQSLIVIGVPQDTTGAAIGVNLLAHELGHALGLADEYSTGSGVSATEASRYANVWQPSDPCYDPPSFPSSTAATVDVFDIPWSGELDCQSALDPLWDCDSDLLKNNYGCPRVWWPSHTSMACTATAALPDDCKPYVGLYEGAFYALTGVYRPANDCKMRTSSTDFCGVCRALIDKFFTCNYINPSGC
jgi:hypothetical protein